MAKEEESRPTGLGIVDQVPWGSHFCLFYETDRDLADVLCPYFKSGLDHGECCLWVMARPEGEEDLQAAFRRAIPGFDQRVAAGDFEIIPSTEWYLQDGTFNGARVIAGWGEKLEAALAKGYRGLRVGASEAWLSNAETKDFSQYEKQLEQSLTDQRMIVLCAYPLAASAAAQLLDVARSHQFAIAIRKGKWEIVETPGLRKTKEEIERMNEQLERRVAERTRELAEANRLLHRSRGQLRALAGRLESLREEEHTRISREIHDDLGQKLTGLKMDLKWTEQKIGELQNVAANPILDRVVGATEIVDDIIQGVQEIAADLRPSVLDKLGLGTALEFEARRFQERTAIVCEVRLPPATSPFSTEVSTALFRILQECLTNVARHARATAVRVELKLERDSALLSVQDNGQGISPGEIDNPRSLGLLGMKERASLLGGEVLVKSEPGRGTLVTACIPTTR